MPERISTPICDYVRAYAETNPLRLHMPGHKGIRFLGGEPYDITEIDGADSLYSPEGIIAESEGNASKQFGSKTLYSVEGSSQCIRAMLEMAIQRVSAGTRPCILAGRNVHRTFLSAAALLDFDVSWMFSEKKTGMISCTVSPDTVREALDHSDAPICAVYLTTPDYLGNQADVSAISEVCQKKSIPLLIDNAHGAYLKFLPVSRHPIDLGADICCDSAHKTLPALTGAAYLHIRSDDRYGFIDKARDAMALFGSTSPSYLILQSLDMLNSQFDDYRSRLASFLPKTEELKTRLRQHGFSLIGSEPLKLAIDAKAYGFTGNDLKDRLIGKGLVPEFADPDYLVLMLSPYFSDFEMTSILDALTSIGRRKALSRLPAEYPVSQQVFTFRETMFAQKERIPTEKCEGRVLGEPCVSCPPAVPIIMCGERIDRLAIEWFRYYGIKELSVLKEEG